METTTKQDKLLFFGITSATLITLTYIIHYVTPIQGVKIEYLFLAPLFISGIITSLRFGFEETQLKEKGATLYFISAITWSTLSAIKWLKYFNKDNFDWIAASIFTLVAIINWVSFFKKMKK
jgi:hypothetical protein